MLLTMCVILGTSFAITSPSTTVSSDDDDEITPSEGGSDQDQSAVLSSCSSSSSSYSIQFHPNDSSLVLHHFDSTTSTQDEAKKIAEILNNPHKTNNDEVDKNDDEINDPYSDKIQTFCVTATEQTNGRGTSGRMWIGARGNTFVTIGIPVSSMMDLKHIPLTLLPLKIGTIVAKRVQKLLDREECQINDYDDGEGVESNVNVKWPNDVLVNDDKLSGVLIESSSNWFLIGIGVNIAYAPPIPSSGPNYGRTSTCIQDICSSSSSGQSYKNDTPPNVEQLAQQMGVNLAHDLHVWIQKQQQQLRNPYTTEEAEIIVDEWKKWVNWDRILVMRDTPDKERVRLVDVLPDGRVQVMGESDARLQTLVSDYFI